jgi:peptide/nickel transport system permease protein
VSGVAASLLSRRQARTARWSRAVLRTPSALTLLAIVLLAVVGPLLAPDPIELTPEAPLARPSLDHPFGTDQNGMDVLARLINAARIDLSVAFAASALAVVFGVPLGALAAYRGGWVDQVLMRTAEAFQAFPALLLAMGIVAALGPSLVNLVVVIALVNVPVYLRMTRSAVMPLRRSEYVLAARSAGRTTPQILARHVMPNVSEVVVAQFAINCAWAIYILAALSFIGLGVQLPTPEWGAMVRSGVDYLVYGQWWVSVFPGVAIFVTVLALTQLSDRVRHGDGG